MSVDLVTLPERLDVPKHFRHRPQWRRAWRAMRALLEDPDHTAHALEVGYALDGDDAARGLPRFLAHPEGRRLLFERPCLLDKVGDRDWLASLPEGSFGRAYLAHMDRNGFEARSLIALHESQDPIHGRSADERWYLERFQLMHDLWHVLSGYGADGSGEAALLPFTLAQRGTRAGALLTLGAALKIYTTLGTPWLAYVWRAWRRGRRAAPLEVLRYEELLPLPLDEVRRAVRIDAPERAHPGGVVDDSWMAA